MVPLLLFVAVFYPLLFINNDYNQTLITGNKTISYNDSFNTSFLNLTKYNVNLTKYNVNLTKYNVNLTNVYNNTDVYYNSKLCKFCNSIVALIKNEIMISNKTINEVDDVLRFVCNHTRLVYKKECLDIIDDLQFIVNLILLGISPRNICQRISLC